MSQSLRECVQQFAPEHMTSNDGFAWVQHLADDSLRSVVHCVAMSLAEETPVPPMVAEILVEVVRRLHRQPLALDTQTLDALTGSYARHEDRPAVQMLVLRVLAATGDASSVQACVRLLVEGREFEARLLVELFGEFVRLPAPLLSGVLPTLLEAVTRPALASFVLDLANFAYREHALSEHPAESRKQELMSLLSQLAERLGELQDRQPSTPEEASQLGKQVTESVALAVGLCHALAGIGDDQAVASLNKALQVEHRRLRVEAAAALAQLGVEDARALLVAMAADPVERLRVLSYAEELEIQDEVDESFASAVARAEAELVMHLAQPSQVGIAPQHIELIDQSELAWPGYEEPRTCYLFRYVYTFPDREVSNVGIAGPLVMTFGADLTHLNVDDLYALFAGWHVEHAEIYAVPWERTVGTLEQHAARLLSVARESVEHTELRPMLAGYLLDRPVMVASAEREEELGWLVVSDDALNWVPAGNPQAPLGAGEAFYLFIGRALLRSFN